MKYILQQFSRNAFCQEQICYCALLTLLAMKSMSYLEPILSVDLLSDGISAIIASVISITCIDTKGRKKVGGYHLVCCSWRK